MAHAVSPLSKNVSVILIFQKSAEEDITDSHRTYYSLLNSDHNRFPGRAKIRTLLEKVSTILLMLVVALVLVTNLGDIYHYIIGILGIFISLVSVMIYGTLGYILGGPRIPTKRSLAFDTAIRNDAVALLIATQSFSDHPNVAVVVVVFGLTQIIILGAMAYYWSKKSKGLESIKVNTKDRNLFPIFVVIVAK